MDLGLYMSKPSLLPVSIEVVRHELVVGEGDLLVPEGGLHLLGVRAAVDSVETDPLTAGVKTPRLSFDGEKDLPGKHPLDTQTDSDRDCVEEKEADSVQNNRSASTL